MSLKNTTTYTKGFTIVELLIVIVVIGILAAITIISFNGITARAKTGSAQSTYEIVIKKAENFKAITGGYPLTAADFQTYSESSLTGTGIVFYTAGALDGTQSPQTVSYAPCTAAPVTGVRIRYYDYATPKVVVQDSGTITSCGTISGGPF